MLLFPFELVLNFYSHIILLNALNIITQLVSNGVFDKTRDKQTHIVPVPEEFQLYICYSH